MRDEYDKHGRLAREEITHPDGHGKIAYRYQGDTMQVVQVTCEGNFEELRGLEPSDRSALQPRARVLAQAEDAHRPTAPTGVTIAKAVRSLVKQTRSIHLSTTLPVRYWLSTTSKSRTAHAGVVSAAGGTQ
jgi:hypothetical protein